MFQSGAVHAPLFYALLFLTVAFYAHCGSRCAPRSLICFMPSFHNTVTIKNPSRRVLAQ